MAYLELPKESGFDFLYDVVRTSYLANSYTLKLMDSSWNKEVGHLRKKENESGQVGQDISVMPRHTFVQTNQYGYPNIEPKIFRTRFVKRW